MKLLNIIVALLLSLNVFAGRQIIGEEIVNSSSGATVIQVPTALLSAGTLSIDAFGNLSTSVLPAPLLFTSPLVETAGTVEINGSVADDKLWFNATADATKLLKFDLSGMTTGKTLTFAPLITSNQTIQFRPLATAGGAGTAIVQDNTTGFILIGTDTSIGGANSGLQYSNATTANRGQIRLGSYVNAASVAGVTTATSKSGTIAVNSAIGTSQDYSKWTAQAAATTAGSLPISGSWAFKSGAALNALTVPTDWHLSLTNNAGTLADRLYVTSEGVIKFPNYGVGFIQSDASGVLSSAALTSGNITTALGFTPEDVANKSTDGTFAANSDTLYPSQKAAKTYADSKVADVITDGVTTIAPSENAVFDALALKAVIASQVNEVWVSKGGVDASCAIGRSDLPCLTVQKAADLIGTAASNADFNDATMRSYIVHTGPGVYTENVTFGTRPFINLDLNAGALIVGNVTAQFDQGAINGAGLQSPSFQLSGPNARSLAGGAATIGVQGDVITESINSGSSLVNIVHIRGVGITGKFTHKNTAPAGGYTTTLFIEGSIIQGVIEETTGTSSITLYADNCNDSSSNSLGAVSGSVTLNVINDVRFNGAVVTSAANHGRWFNVEFKSGQAHDFTGFSGSVSADANSYETFQANVPTKGTGTFTLLDSARGVKNTAAGNISSTNVQSALNELDTEKEPLLVNSAGLRAALSDETGTAFAVFSDSPALTGNPTVPNQSPLDSSSKIANTKYVDDAVALVTAGSGILSLNGQTGATQLFANGSSGLAPAFVSAADTHTLNIPLASGAGVTSGTVSKTEYDAFVAKQDALINSAGLAAALSDETGTGFAVFSVSPALTGSPTAPTQAANDNSTKVATTAYADAKVADVITNGVTTIAPSENAVFDALALKQDLLTNSAGLAAALSDETGTGFAVFSISPALTGSPTAPTQSAADNSTKIATTAYVDGAGASKSNAPTVQAKSANFTAAYDFVYIVTNAVDIQLPAPSVGKIFWFKKVGSGTINLLRAGSEKIENIAADMAFTSDKESAMVITDGTDWFVI